jgi:hypothetical protein
MNGEIIDGKWLEKGNWRSFDRTQLLPIKLILGKYILDFLYSLDKMNLQRQTIMH